MQPIKPMQRAGERARAPHVLTSLRSAGHCDKLPIQRSPWVLPINKKNQTLKLDYCNRNLAMAQALVWELHPQVPVEAITACHLWEKRIGWVKANKL
jgi:hypothetical protein